MADERYVIDVAVNAQDNTAEVMQRAQQGVSKFDQSLEQSRRMAERMSRTPYDLTIRAVDRASGVMDRISARGMELARRPFEVVIRARDLATAPIRGVMDMLTSYQTYMLGVLGAGVGAAAIAWPIKLADNLQQATIAFTTMLGSAQKAQQFMAQVQQFAIATPFSTEDIVKNAQFMMALGFSAKQVIPTLQAVGDAASAMGGSADLIQRILLALGQMQAHGKVDAQDMLQLTSANIPAWQILADKMHKTVAQVQDLASKGKLEAAPAVQAILQGMEKLYGGQMQRNANKTVSGLLSQITDTFKIDIVTKWGQGIEQAVLPALARFNDWLGKNKQLVTQWGNALKNVAYQGAQWVVDKVHELMSAVGNLVQSPAWQNAPTFWDKLKVGWHELIVVPFDRWWNGPGHQAVARIAAQMGTFLGGSMNAIISGLLGLASGKGVGVKQNAFTSAGQTAGSAFFQAFLKAFDAQELANKAKQAFIDIQPSFGHSTGQNIMGLLVDFLLLRAGMRGLRGIVESVDMLRRVGRGVRGVGSLFRGARPGGGVVAEASHTATDVARAAEHAAPTLSGLVDRFGRPIQSMLKDAEHAVAQTAGRAGIRGLLRRIPGVDLLLGGMDVMSSLRAGTRMGRFTGVGGAIGSTVGSIALGALGTAVAGPIGGIIGGVVGDFAGRALGGLTGRLLSHINWGALARGIASAVRDLGNLRDKGAQAIAQLAERLRSGTRSIGSELSAGFRSAVKGAVGWFKNLFDDVTGWLGKLGNWVKGHAAFLFTLAGGGIGLGAGTLWKWMWHRGQSNSTPQHKPPGFASGVRNFGGGVALVGEQGPELVYLPPGSSVIPAGETRGILSGQSLIAGFVQDIDKQVSLLPYRVTYWFDMMRMRSTAVLRTFRDTAVLLFDDLGKSAQNSISQTMDNIVRQVTDAQAKIQAQTPMTAQPTSAGTPASVVPNHQQVAGWLTRALKLTRTPMSWLPGLMQLVAAESSGNPLAVNPITVLGQHATGLLQMLPSTFREYAMRGLQNILNPVANAVAAIRYIKDRYGTVYNTPLFKGGPYKGYASGGIIHEPIAGVGLRTGTRYMMGERGPERIVPVGEEQTSHTVAVPVGRQGPRQTSIHVTVEGVSLSVNVSNGNPQTILSVLKAHATEVARQLADSVAEEIGKQLERTHANMPTPVWP